MKSVEELERLFAASRARSCAALLVALSLAGCGAPDTSAADDPGAGADDGGARADEIGDAGADAHEANDAAATRDGGVSTKDGSAPDATAPDASKLPWKTGTNVGFGVATKDTENPAGESIFIAYAGYEITLASAEAWAEALYEATLKARGVRYLYAVQGPSDPTYTQKEIGNSKIVTAMLAQMSAQTKYVLVVGHSSGTFVAHELLGQLQGGADPQGLTAQRVVYFNLDGGSDGLDAAIVGRLKKAYFAGSYESTTDTHSPNFSTMQSLGATYASAGGFYQNDANGSGCNAGATWCVHVTLVTTKPHDPANADPAHDYSDFAGHPVAHAYLDAKAAAAGL